MAIELAVTIESYSEFVSLLEVLKLRLCSATIPKGGICCVRVATCPGRSKFISAMKVSL